MPSENESDTAALESTVSHAESPPDSKDDHESVKSTPPEEHDPTAEEELDRKLREYSASIREYTIKLLLELNEKRAKNEKLEAERAERQQRRQRATTDTKKTNDWQQ